MKKHNTLALSLLLAAVMLITSCGSNEPETGTATTPAAATTAAVSEASDPETVSFTDSVGRVVQLPATIDTVAPSGPLAQIVLYTAAPEKLAGVARSFSQSQMEYFPAEYGQLPEFGQFYGKNSTLNMETLLANRPDVIIDIGEVKGSVVEDMDGLQEQLNMPVVYIEAKLGSMAETYKKLGELFGDTSRTDSLAAYSAHAIETANTIREEIAEEDKVRVYWAMGDLGLNTNADGSFHAEALDLVGVKNVAEVELVSSGAGAEISFEQLLLWQPDFILFDTPALAESLAADEQWAALEAMQNGNTAVVPTQPYSVLASPPSVNRILGIYWLGQTVYPELYDLDLREVFSQFYQLFYHSELSEMQLDELLGQS